MPLAESFSTDCQYSQHVNPQWVKLLNVLELSVSYERCMGAELFTREGRRILDFLSGYCVHNVGHNHPDVLAAVRDELEKRGPVMLQSHVPELAGELAERLCNGAGGRLAKVFFASSGSEGIEAAIKFSRAHTGRTGLLYADRAFHGLTCGALSLMNGEYWRSGFGPLLPETDAVPFGDLKVLKQKLATLRYAAFFVEPVQAEGGIRIPDSDYLPEWFDGSLVNDITPDGKAIAFLEWGGPAGPLYICGYRKMDGSAPVALGPGAQARFSPDGATVAASVPSRPPQIALNPVGTGQSRRLSPGDLTNLRPSLAWFPDGKHLLLIGAPEGQPLRTYVMDIEGGKTQALGPAGFFGIAVAGDGKRIAGRNAAEEAAVFDRETEKVQAIPGIARQELIQRWTDDGRALIVYSATAWEAHIYRVDVATGKRTLLQNIELSEKAGSRLPIRLAYAEPSKTYAYGAVRDLGILYVVEGVQ